MKKFKTNSIIILVLSLMLIGGCTFSNLKNNNENVDKEAKVEQSDAHVESDMKKINAHIGCQESEIGINGECFPATDNNTAIFQQDLSSVDFNDLKTEDFSGFFAKPNQENSNPGVLMIHEWWGLNDNIKQMAKILANEGYNVLAIDLYDGKVASSSDDAKKYASEVRNNPEVAIAKMKSAVSYLRDTVGVEKIASLGWCFGGQHSLLLSLNEKLDATVIYYGQLEQDKEKLKNITTPVLGVFGDQDTSITVSDVNNFKSNLDELKIPNSINIYAGVGHAFANPSGTNYAPKETLDAWKKTLDFLNENLNLDISEIKTELTN